ncbi:hypothetical protein [Neisseria lactamica]|nr:hypothetical protein [Neisseria lactamica]
MPSESLSDGISFEPRGGIPQRPPPDGNVGKKDSDALFRMHVLWNR